MTDVNEVEGITWPAGAPLLGDPLGVLVLGRMDGGVGKNPGPLIFAIGHPVCGWFNELRVDG